MNVVFTIRIIFAKVPGKSGGPFSLKIYHLSLLSFVVPLNFSGLLNEYAMTLQ